MLVYNIWKIKNNLISFTEIVLLSAYKELLKIRMALLSVWDNNAST